jgi:hypothetical protein
MLDVRKAECVLGQLALACTLLFIAAASTAIENEPSRQISSTDIEQSVISSLPKANGKSAEIVEDLDLTQPFKTQSQWTFIVANLPGSQEDGVGDEIDSGGLVVCFVERSTPHCDQVSLSNAVSLSSADVVFAGADHTDPLLLVRANSAGGADGNHSIDTEIWRFDGARDQFTSIFSNSTGSNNNQRTRFVDEGPLRGDVIVDVPAGCCYFIDVYRQEPSGRYVSVLGYQGRTVYGDGNPLSVADSEMPEILRRLGLWHKGDALPIPHEGCNPVMRRGEEWCQ